MKRDALNMHDSLDPRLCRILAQKARDNATAATDIDLQQCYFELADDYETMADTLERIQRKSGRESGAKPDQG